MRYAYANGGCLILLAALYGFQLVVDARKEWRGPLVWVLLLEASNIAGRNTRIEGHPHFGIQLVLLLASSA